MATALKLRLVKAEASLKELSAKLGLLSPYSVLDRGYSLTTDEHGTVVREASAVAAGTRLRTRLQKGVVESVVC